MKYANKLSDKVYEIPIRGIIGAEVSGAMIANEIKYLEGEGAEKIILRINSAGGDVIDGYNIVSAILTSPLTIETVNEGIAASMAAVILAAGDNRKAFDYSTALIHDPQMSGQTLEDVQDEQQKANLSRIKDSLVKILKDSTGKPENTISKLMTRETVMSAKEQKDFGLVDAVVKSRIKKEPVANMSLVGIMNHWNDEKNNKPKSEKMEKLTNFLNLAGEASEQSILDAIKSIQSSADDFKGKFEAAQEELATAKIDLAEAGEKLKGIHDQAVTLSVNSAIEAGKFPEDQRETLTKQATKDLDFFNEMVEAIPVHHKSVMDVINQADDKDDKNKEKKDWDYYQKNDPIFLTDLEKSDPAAYGKLYQDYWGEKYEPAKS